MFLVFLHDCEDLVFPAVMPSGSDKQARWIKSLLGLQIASCSDDHTVRIWRLHREMDGAQSSVGEANLVGWARGPKSPSSKHNSFHDHCVTNIYIIYIYMYVFLWMV